MDEGLLLEAEDTDAGVVEEVDEIAEDGRLSNCVLVLDARLERV